MCYACEASNGGSAYLVMPSTVVGAHGRLAEREVALATSIAYTRIGLRC
jgi:hypothetical protein